MPARTKLPRTMTGKMFSLIFSFLPASARPNTMCCTLFDTLLHVLNASACGLDERSWRYVWNSQKVCQEKVSRHGAAEESAPASRLHRPGGEGEGRTRSAAVTDSSHKSRRNSSKAIDSLSTLMIRWHNCGRKNSMSS